MEGDPSLNMFSKKVEISEFCGKCLHYGSSKDSVDPKFTTYCKEASQTGIQPPNVMYQRIHFMNKSWFMFENKLQIAFTFFVVLGMILSRALLTKQMY